MNNLDIIDELKENIPESIGAIGYGSGVFKQTGYSEDEKPDKDLILIVKNFKQFLIDDYQMNPDHFSKDFNSNILYKAKEKNDFYDNLGCLKFYHNNIHFKMMVISKDALCEDLTTWKYFGMAGRLSKPIIYRDLPEDLENYILNNKQNVLITALLSTEKDQMSTSELYNIISSLTYKGDFRTILPGEKRTKASDIVNGALEYFDSNYKESPLLRSNGNTIYNDHPLALIDFLPTNLKETIYSKLNIQENSQLTDEDISKTKEIINEYFRQTNFINSIRLAISSGTTLGKKETIKHGIAKFQKHLKR
jgi:translocator assembly and maintenance protein 41